MAITKITNASIAPGSISASALAEGVGGGPKIANVQIANSSYGVLDDTAIALEGGYLVITGAGFASGCQVIVGSNTATSTTFVNSTTIRAQVGAADAGTKTVYVVNTDGGTAIRVNGLTYSATPTWVTGSTLTEASVDEAISIQLDASLATSYQLQAGSSLPAGLSLAANGLLTGTVTGIEAETTYSFTIEAIDAENQESPRSFSITITFGEEYFYATTLLLNGDGTNGANNNTFVDSSTNNFAITRNGNVTQGTFSPFSAPEGRWSAYFDGTGDYLSVPTTSTQNQWWTEDFTIDAWVYPTNLSTWSPGTGPSLIGNMEPGTTINYWSFGPHTNGTVRFKYFNGDPVDIYSTETVSLNEWSHIALVKDSNGIRIYVNGVGTTSTAVSGTPQTSTGLTIGQHASNSIQGYVSNIRIVKGTALYTSNFTPSTSPLTATTNTSLLTCQSNRFKDNSTNNFAITRNGDVKVTSFGPFTPTGSYSAATNGGSGYFDGTGDRLSIADSAEFILGNNFTIECWVQFTSTSGIQQFVTQRASLNDCWQFLYNWPSAGNLTFKFADANVVINRAWNPTVGQWYHISVTRDGNTWYLFSNGVQLGTTATNSTTFPDISAPLVIGEITNGGGENFVGYMSGLRITKSSLYTSGFSVPTSPPTNISNTVLLCNFTNGGIIDYTGKNNLETVGNARISTSVKKYGTGSLEFDGSEDQLVGPDNEMFNFGTGDFTLECWIYSLSSSGFQTFLSTRNSSNSNIGNSIFFGFNLNTRNPMIYTTGLVLASSTAVSGSTWTHVAVTRQNGTLRIFIDGTQTGTTSFTTAMTGTRPSVGLTSAGEHAFNGYIDDLRVTKGIARYTANFTPPTSAHRLR